MPKEQEIQPRIGARHGKITEGTKEHITQSCRKLEQYFDGILNCEVVLDKKKHGDKVEIIVKLPQHTFTASASADNLYKRACRCRVQGRSAMKETPR